MPFHQRVFRVRSFREHTGTFKSEFKQFPKPQGTQICGQPLVSR